MLCHKSAQTLPDLTQWLRSGYVRRQRRSKQVGVGIECRLHTHTTHTHIHTPHTPHTHTHTHHTPTACNFRVETPGRKKTLFYAGRGQQVFETLRARPHNTDHSRLSKSVTVGPTVVRSSHVQCNERVHSSAEQSALISVMLLLVNQQN